MITSQLFTNNVTHNTKCVILLITIDKSNKYPIANRISVQFLLVLNKKRTSSYSIATITHKLQKCECEQ